MLQLAYSAEEMACGGNDEADVVESAYHGIEVTVRGDSGT